VSPINEVSTEITNMEPTNDDRMTNFIIKNKENATLHRSASIVSNYRPRSGPAGLYSYTGQFDRISKKIQNIID